MKKFFTIFFVTLGVVFFILILLGTYFFITDPLNLKPLLFGQDQTDVQNGEIKKIETVADDDENQEDKNPVLNEDQEKALQGIGVDPSDVPTQFTKEQEACFEETLGAERVEEIKAGATPTTSEFYKVRDCW